MSPVEGTAGVRALRWGGLAYARGSRVNTGARVESEGKRGGDEIGEVTEGSRTL